MAGLSTFQSGPKGSKGTKMVNLSVFDPFGSFQTKIDFFSKAPPPNPTLSIWGKKSFLSEMAQKGPDGPKRALNGQKHLG